MTWIIAARFLRERAEAGYMILLVPGELSPNRGERASGKRALAWLRIQADTSLFFWRTPVLAQITVRRPNKNVTPRLLNDIPG